MHTNRWKITNYRWKINKIVLLKCILSSYLLYRINHESSRNRKIVWEWDVIFLENSGFQNTQALWSETPTQLGSYNHCNYKRTSFLVSWLWFPHGPDGPPCDFPESLHKFNYSEQYQVFLKVQYKCLWNVWWIIMRGCAVLVLSFILAQWAYFMKYLKFITLLYHLTAIIKICF